MSHAATCRRGYFSADGWVEGDAPPGVAQWHSATCEGRDAQRAYALDASQRYRYVTDEDDGKRVDQSQRYARAILEMLYD